MEREDKIYVAGHRGLVGSSIIRALAAAGYDNIITASSCDLDLREQAAVREYFSSERPDYVFLAAAKVGGVLANDTFPADFIYQNLVIETNVIECARQFEVKKLLFLGSTCIYPKDAPQPVKEEYLLTSSLEPTNEWYAVAKIAGIKLCEAYQKQYGCNFISAMPTNLYGPNDNFDLQSSHVIPALIRKFHEAAASQSSEVVVWGSGKPLREFVHVDDCASACLFLMENYDGPGIVNIGVGEDVSIKDLAVIISKVTAFKGEIVFDRTMPDGTLRKLVDTTRLSELGWKVGIGLEEGIQLTYKWFLANLA